MQPLILNALLEIGGPALRAAYPGPLKNLATQILNGYAPQMAGYLAS